jgi:hypothetical protein
MRRGRKKKKEKVNPVNVHGSMLYKLQPWSKPDPYLFWGLSGKLILFLTLFTLHSPTNSHTLEKEHHENRKLVSLATIPSTSE